MQVVQRIDLSGKDPDAILYDASSKRVFTFNGGGTKDASAIDTGTGKVNPEGWNESMHYERAPCFRRLEQMMWRGLRCAVQGFATLRRAER
jgi:hypothetical protein